MKSQDFGSILRSFADLLDAAGARHSRDQIVSFAAIFDATPTSTVATLAKRLAALPTSGTSGSPSLGDVARLLAPLKKFLSKAGKAGVVTDFETIERLLRDRASMEIGTFVQMANETPPATRRVAKTRAANAVRDDLVSDYHRKLEAALGDEEQFAVIYNDLSSNSAIGKPELVALAKQLTRTSPRSKADALKKIRSRHQSLLTFKAKSRATGGRSAA